jgi:hypothetical protein
MYGKSSLSEYLLRIKCRQKDIILFCCSDNDSTFCDRLDQKVHLQNRTCNNEQAGHFLFIEIFVEESNE